MLLRALLPFVLVALLLPSSGQDLSSNMGKPVWITARATHNTRARRPKQVLQRIGLREVHSNSVFASEILLEGIPSASGRASGQCIGTLGGGTGREAGARQAGVTGDGRTKQRVKRSLCLQHDGKQQSRCKECWKLRRFHLTTGLCIPHGKQKSHCRQCDPEVGTKKREEGREEKEVVLKDGRAVDRYTNVLLPLLEAGLRDHMQLGNKVSNIQADMSAVSCGDRRGASSVLSVGAASADAQNLFPSAQASSGAIVLRPPQHQIQLQISPTEEHLALTLPSLHIMADAKALAKKRATQCRHQECEREGTQFTCFTSTKIILTLRSCVQPTTARTARLCSGAAAPPPTRTPQPK